MDLLQKDVKFLSQFGLSSVTDRFDLSSKVLRGEGGLLVGMLGDLVLFGVCV